MTMLEDHLKLLVCFYQLDVFKFKSDFFESTVYLQSLINHCLQKNCSNVKFVTKNFQAKVISINT